MTVENVAVNLGDLTPRRMLVDWANGQDAWVRKLTAETILSQRAPSDELLDSVYAVFLGEKGLGEEIVDVPMLEPAASVASEEETLELVSLSEVESVNALAADQRVDFDSDLTVLFGQNGSGKTGYARILKRIAGVRTAEDILPNANVVQLDPDAGPAARIDYRLSGADTSVEWHNQAGLAPFTRISVFDSSAVLLHVDSDLGYVFTPAELALFTYVASGIQGVQQRIAAEAAALAPGNNQLLARFGRGTAVYRHIETLGPATDLADLDTLATIPEDSAKTLDRLEGEIAALRSNSLDALLTTAEEHKRQLNRLQGVLVTAQAFDEEAYEVARTALWDAEQRRTAAREQLFTAGELPGPPDEDWQAFVVAGDTYRGHLGRDEYPTSADSCLYCMQDLGAEALDLLTRYRTFLDETLVRQVTDAAAARDRARLRLDDNELTRAIEFAGRQGERDDPPSWATVVCAALDAAQIVVHATRSGEAVPRAGLREEAQPAAGAVAEALAATTITIQQLASDKADATKALAARRSEHAELAARIELKRNLHVARDYVQRSKRAQQLDKLSHGISNGPAKQLTLQAKLASEDLVNKNFESLFADECERLRAPQVVLRFQGRSGQSQRKKVVATYKPSSVLSEGEQKVLALADFLAESRMRGIKAPLVFDDPVTSLDYRRLDEVATRIQILAETHQVIVFTHNIMFASALISARQSKTLRVKFYEVRDGGQFKGILAPDVEPRLDNPAELAKKINVKLQAIPGAEPVVQDALIKETYDLIRAWCEAFVEQELLQNVTQRFRSNIMMTRLTKIDSTRLDAAIAVIDPLFVRACERMTGHSHAGEYLSTKPTVADLQEDWDKAKAARAAYLAN